ncbi:MAG: ribosome assembly cofactor RimP [Bacteroidaceae bacterium]
MIDKNTVIQIVEEWLADKEYFLVQVTVSSDARIVIEIDHSEGVWIEDCVALSRFVEAKLDRDEQDFELEVGSAGIGQPFLVEQQYLNNVGKEVELMTKTGLKKEGVLTQIGDNQLTIIATEKVKEEGQKRPKAKEVSYTYSLDDLKWTKALITFK